MSVFRLVGLMGSPGFDWRMVGSTAVSTLISGSRLMFSLLTWYSMFSGGLMFLSLWIRRSLCDSSHGMSTEILVPVLLRFLLTFLPPSSGNSTVQPVVSIRAQVATEMTSLSPRLNLPRFSASILLDVSPMSV